MFTESKHHPHGLTQFPIRLIPSLWGSTDDVRKGVASELHSMASISVPAVVVEDTHPNPIHLPAEIRRVLLVRPTSFEYLIRLKEQYGPTYSAFLLCDSPDSPTWPYDRDQTRQLAGWKQWHVIGPIYRTPSEDEIREVRTRNHVSEGQEICVFTMGGGGVHVHDPTGRDIVRFLRLALEVADIIQPAGSRVRLLFVKGPYFPARIPIPSRFEVVPDEDQMPALLRIAKGAVIRAGFNTTWECMAAGTPFIPLIGTTFAEPVRERVDNLTALGLVPESTERFWFDEQWRAEYRRITQGVVARHSGRPEPLELERLILGRPPSRSLPQSKIRATRKSRPKRTLPFVIRIDDVVCQEPTLCWLLEALAARGMRASLEVVPYLVEFDEAFLDRFDPSNSFFEVSQHGYAHIPRTSQGASRGEFLCESAAPAADELEMIARGKRHLEITFPKRFTGGFSPPFDALPPWLPASWHALGGAFVSNLRTNSVLDAPLPVIRAGVEVWDWANNRALSRDWVRRKLALQLDIDRYAGIVLHPRCLRPRPEKLRLLSFLNYAEQGTATVSLRDLALGRIELAKSISRGDRFPAG